MFGEHYGVVHDGSQEVLERSTILVVLADLVVDATADALDPSSTSETSNRRFGDALDAVLGHLTMPLGSLLAALARHVECVALCVSVRAGV